MNQRLFLLLAVSTLMTLVAAVGASKIVYEDDVRSVWATPGPELDQLQRFADIFGSDEHLLTVVLSANNFFSTDGIVGLRELTRQLQSVEGVETVYSIFDVRRMGSARLPLMPSSSADESRLARARKAALAHPVVAGQFLSADGRGMQVTLSLDPSRTTVSQLQPVLQEIRRVCRGVAESAPFEAHCIGRPVINVDAVSAVRRDQMRFGLLSGLTGSLVMLIFFRRLAAALIASSAAAIGMVWTLGVVGWVGFPINGINSALPTIAFAIGFTNAAHVLLEIHRQLSAGKSPADAAGQALRLVGPACALATGTSAVGFVSLVATSTPSVRVVGWSCCVASLCSFLSTLIWLPVASSVFYGRFQAAWSAPSQRSITSDILGIASSAVQYPRWITGIGLVSCVICAWVASHLQPDLQLKFVLPAESDVSQGIKLCEQAFGGSVPCYVQVKWPDSLSLEDQRVEDVLRQVHRTIDQRDDFSSPLSILNLVDALPGKDWSQRIAQFRRLPSEHTSRFVSESARALSVTTRAVDFGGQRTAQELDLLRSDLDRALIQSPFEASLTGSAVVATASLQRIVNDLFVSLTLATLIIFPCMALAFRSVRMGIISVIPNALPLLLNGALLVAAHRPLDIAAVVTFSLCLGIAVDDTIHFLMHYRQRTDSTASTQQRLRETIDTVGSVLVTTSVVLIGGFSAMLISSVPTIRLFATLCCLCFLSALIADLVLLPALIVCFDSTPPGMWRKNVDRTSAK